MAPRIHTFRDLEAWQAGMETVVAIYRVAALLPASERYVLSSQMRRAALSIPTNVAEGYSRRSGAAYVNHLNIAIASQAELETEVDLARRLNFIDGTTFEELDHLGNRVRPLLHGLRRAIARHHALRHESPSGSRIPDPRSRIPDPGSPIPIPVY